MSDSNRREFLKGSAGLGLGLAFAGEAATAGGRERPTDYEIPSGYLSDEGFTAPVLETVRIGFVGVGLQGGSHVRNFLAIEGVEIAAICDIDAPRAAEVAQWVADDGRPTPDLYTRGERDFERLCERDDIDLVFNATPWNWHVPVCVAAMTSGKHTAVEVPAAHTIDGCWQLVETAEATGRHCVMMENCCYGRRELMILNMVRAGLLGDLLHAECAYIHDLRAIKFSDKNEGLWRLQHSVGRNGNLYPTHGIGPVAQCLDINRGDRFDYLVSASSPQRGLSLYAERHLPADDPRRGSKYALGDMNTSIVKTVQGRTIMIQHDTTTPRPYSRIDLVQGTAGVVAGYPDRVHVEGRTEPHQWDDLEAYREEFDHRLWRELEADAAGAGHGGMDYLEDYRLIEALRTGTPMDMDVYDGAAWSVLTELSEISVAEGSRPVPFPDFTRGRWARRVPLPLGAGPPSPAGTAPEEVSG
jgi:hypothetical protein